MTRKMAPPTPPVSALTGAGAERGRFLSPLPFQKRFLGWAMKPDIALAALSCPRGNGKSWTSHLVLNEVLPGGKLHVAGGESILLAGSMNQARAVFGFLRDRHRCEQHTDRKCQTCGLRWTDSYQRIGVVHWPTDTKITVRGRTGKLAFGLTNCPVIVGDEPAAWEVSGGQEMIDALVTAAGKTKQLLVLVGTLAPGVDGGWWRELIAAGNQPGIYVQSHAADPAKWNHWREALRVNPVARVNPLLRQALRRELDEAKRDSRAKARWMSFRLNVPSADEISVLLTVSEFERVLDRDVPLRVGRPTVGVDCGAGRAWSAATATWANGRTESIARNGIVSLVEPTHDLPRPVS